MRDFPSYPLLLLFRTLYEEKNLRLTAERLQLPPSTASRHLAELRRFFNDPLFTRFIDELVPTQKATDILPGIERILEEYENLRDSAPPELKEVRRTIRIECADNAIVAFCQRLCEITAKSAPGISYAFSQLTPDRFNLMRSGKLDFAISPMQTAPEGFHSIILGTNEFVLVSGTRHPLVRFADAGRRATDEEVLRYGFIDCAIQSGKNNDGTFTTLREEVFPAWRNARSTACADFFLSFLPTLAHSELLAILPRKTALYFVRNDSIRIIPTHTAGIPLDARLYWHDRIHGDVIMQWVRSVMRESARMPPQAGK